MAKRFTDSDKWKKDWFINLSKEGKLLWIYITDCCDHAGICDFSEKIFSACLDFKVSKEKINESLFSKIIWIEDTKFMIPSFIEFQYGDLNPENRVHKSVLDRINKVKEAPYKPLISPLQGAKDKEQDKDMDMDKDLLNNLKEPTWRDNTETGFNLYLKLSEPCFDELLKDWQWVAIRKEYFPGCCVKRTMFRMWEEFWGTKAGWKNKRDAAKGKDDYQIDWKSTIERNFKKSICYYGKGECDDEKAQIEMMIKMGQICDKQ